MTAALDVDLAIVKPSFRAGIAGDCVPLTPPGR
jgi:hypothetical protein